MSGRFIFRALVGLTLAIGLPAQGPEDAEALVKEAVAYAKTHGTYGLIKAVNSQDGPFRKGSLYIWMVDLEGVTVANARNPGLAGKDDSERKDLDSVPFIQQAVQIAETKGSGWFSYRYSIPDSKQIQEKVCYVEKLGAVVVACGAYKK